jgi:hypothetical protein
MSEEELLQLKLLVEKFHSTYDKFNILLTTTASKETIDDLLFSGVEYFAHLDVELDLDIDCYIS